MKVRKRVPLSILVVYNFTTRYREYFRMDRCNGTHAFCWTYFRERVRRLRISVSGGSLEGAAPVYFHGTKRVHRLPRFSNFDELRMGPRERVILPDQGAHFGDVGQVWQNFPSSKTHTLNHHTIYIYKAFPFP